MLSEHAKNLLIDYVDGVLTDKEHAAAEQMLRDLAEAKAFVKAVKANAAKLKNLPRHKLGAEFTLKLMATLPSTAGSAPGLAKIPQPPAPTPAAVLPTSATVPAAPTPDPAFSELAFPSPKRRLRRGLPAWAVGGIAASIIGILLFGSLAYLRNIDHDRELLPQRPGQTPQVRVKTPIRSEAVDQLIAGIARGAGERYGETKVEIVRPSQEPVRFTFGDLKNQDKFNHLKWELAHASDVHLDITVKYNARSLNRVIESFENHGMRLVVTRPAEESAAKKQPLLVYCENVQPDRLALALRDLSEIDVQGKKKEPSTFDAVKVSHGSPADHKLIAQGLGIDARQLKSPKTPVAQVTPMGVVLPAERIANPSKNGEILSFLSARGPVQIGALQVFVRIEPVEK